MADIRRHTFHGYVQGVGFRCKAAYTAKRFGITGWGRNLDDGSVEMDVERQMQDIGALVQALEAHSLGNIEGINSEYIPVQGG